jgi:hypothetical protein
MGRGGSDSPEIRRRARAVSRVFDLIEIGDRFPFVD